MWSDPQTQAQPQTNDPYRTLQHETPGNIFPNCPDFFLFFLTADNAHLVYLGVLQRRS